MMIVLFIFQVIWCMLILFDTSMLTNHLNKLSGSLSVYHDSKAYKTHEDISFIDKIVKRYRDINDEDKNTVRLAVMIDKELYSERIGQFDYTVVKHLAKNGKFFCWLIILLQLVYIAIKSRTELLLVDIVLMGACLLMSVILEMFLFIQDIETKETILITEVEDYILNIYPHHIQMKAEKKQISSLKSKIEELENELMKYIENTKEKKELKKEQIHRIKEEANKAKEEVIYLKEEDIKNLIQIFK